MLFHGLGLGKTCAAIGIAENFKEQVEKYQTKIYIIVPGPTLKAEWKSQLVKCTGNEYKNNIVQEKGNSNRPLNKSQKEFMRKWEDYIFEINNKEEKENNKEEIKQAV